MHGGKAQHPTHVWRQRLARRYVRLVSVALDRHHLATVGAPKDPATARHRGEVRTHIHAWPVVASTTTTITTTTTTVCTSTNAAASYAARAASASSSRASTTCGHGEGVACRWSMVLLPLAASLVQWQRGGGRARAGGREQGTW